MSSVLRIAQEAADICAVQRPIDLFSNSSQNDILFASVLKSTLSSLMRHADWQTLTRDISFKTTDGQTDYLISDIAPDFQNLVNATIYIDGNRCCVKGALTNAQWCEGKKIQLYGTDIYFKIQNNKMMFLKNPGNMTVYLTYKSNAVCFDGITHEPKSEITSNNDMPVFDEYLVKLGVVWRFEKRSGLDYAEEYNEYQRELNKSYALANATGDIELVHRSDMLVNEGVIADVDATSNTNS